MKLTLVWLLVVKVTKEATKFTNINKNHQGALEIIEFLHTKLHILLKKMGNYRPYHIFKWLWQEKRATEISILICFVIFVVACCCFYVLFLRTKP